MVFSLQKGLIMGTWFVGNSLWHLVRQVDAVTMFVLLLLLGMSVMCWTVFVCKVIVMFFKRRQLKKVSAHVKNARTLPELLEVATAHKNSTPGYFLSTNLIFLKFLSENKQDSFAYHEWDMLQRHIDQSLDTMVSHEESYLSLLSTSAPVAPLLGLFGTVWGLMHAFMSIGEKQIADIATVAPGIGQALTTTLAGLMVAIPALIMFNYLHVQVQKIEQCLVVIADKLSMIACKARNRSSYAPHDSIAQKKNTIG